jgi:lipoate-protein ligase B
MIVSLKVTTEDVHAALDAFKLAVECGATDLSLQSVEDFENKVERFSLSLRVDHTFIAMSKLDDGPFQSVTHHIGLL